MTNRKIREAGINPVIGLVLGAAGFILISAYAFQKTGFAKYLVLLVVMSVLIKMSERNRTEFLMIVFGEIKTRKIRIAENLLISLPFLILLIYHDALLESIILILASVLLASFSFKTKFNYSIPTPFYKHPFEFTAGFRNTFYVFPFVYLLTFIAISVDNLNLGVFAMLLIFLVSLSYYIKPENEYYVWSYAASPAKFLFGKLKIASMYSSLSALPLLIGLIAFYPGEAALC